MTAVVGKDLVVVVADDGSGASALARSLSDHLAEAGIHATIGIGGAYTKPNGLRWSYFEARDAASHGLPVNEPERLSLTSLLLASEDVPLADMANESLNPLRTFDAAHGAELMATLESYLSNNGSVAAVAEDLTLHRNTVRYRLAQITELTGYDPAVRPRTGCSCGWRWRCSGSGRGTPAEPAEPAEPARGGHRPSKGLAGKAIQPKCEFSRVAQCDQVSALDFVNAKAEPGPDHAALKVHREEAVIVANQHLCRHVGPPVDPAGLPERRARWSALLAGARGNYLRGNVVEEVHAFIKIAAASVQPVVELECLRLAGCVPPLAGRLTGKRDHRIEQDNQLHRYPPRDNRDRKGAQGLAHENHVAEITDGRDHGVGVVGQSQTGVVLADIDRNGAVPQPFQFRNQPMPIPACSPGARDKDESGHLSACASVRVVLGISGV